VDKLETRTDAWAMWHGTTEQQKKKEMAALEETLDLLKSHLGWDAPRPADTLWSSCNSIQRKQLFMLRRMYLLGEYARSLPQTAASSTGAA
jgi:ribulose bisphosphate carboxylase small subunit